MANFYISLSNAEIATQIAGLLNQHNKLRKTHNTTTIMYSNANYLVEADRNKIVGCVAVEKKDNITLIKHVSVHPNYRRMGISSKLINLAINSCNTVYIYMTIRDDNLVSLLMAVKLGFILLKSERAGDHNIITVGREK